MPRTFFTQTMSENPTFLDELNHQQKEACLCEQNILLTACPGSGKTRTLAYRLAYLQNCFPESSLLNIAITYTNKAAEEISERLEILINKTESIWVGTIHQFCLNFVLYPYAQYSPKLNKGFRIVDEWEQQKLKKEHKKNYENYLEKEKLIDFDGILAETLNLLQTETFIAKNLAYIFRSLLIDEYQDTQEIQYEILASIYRHNPSIRLFFVGDPNQAIYGGLGGLAKTVTELQNQFNTDFTSLTLSGCYRSDQKIIDYYRHFELTPVEIKSCIEKKDSIVYFNKILPSQDLPRQIAKIIRKEIQRGTELHEICIVAPQWRLLSAMANDLKKLLGITFHSSQITPFKYDPDNLFYFLARILFTRRGRKTNVRLKWASKILIILSRKYGIDATSNVSSMDILNLINRTEYSSKATDYFTKATVHLFSEFRLDQVTKQFIAQDFCNYFLEVENRLKAYKFSDLTEDIYELLKKQHGVNIDTIHGIKGKEFEVVIAFSLHEGKVPHSSITDKIEARKEASRLLYVLCSRAKSRLFLFSESDIKNSPTQELDKLINDYDELPLGSS